MSIPCKVSDFSHSPRMILLPIRPGHTAKKLSPSPERHCSLDVP